MNKLFFALTILSLLGIAACDHDTKHRIQPDRTGSATVADNGKTKDKKLTTDANNKAVPVESDRPVVLDRVGFRQTMESVVKESNLDSQQPLTKEILWLRQADTIYRESIWVMTQSHISNSNTMLLQLVQDIGLAQSQEKLDFTVKKPEENTTGSKETSTCTPGISQFELRNSKDESHYEIGISRCPRLGKKAIEYAILKRDGKQLDINIVYNDFNDLFPNLIGNLYIKVTDAHCVIEADESSTDMEGIKSLSCQNLGQISTYRSVAGAVLLTKLEYHQKGDVMMNLESSFIDSLEPTKERFTMTTKFGWGNDEIKVSYKDLGPRPTNSPIFPTNTANPNADNPAIPDPKATDTPAVDGFSSDVMDADQAAAADEKKTAEAAAAKEPELDADGNPIAPVAKKKIRGAVTNLDEGAADHGNATPVVN